jgi:hypothetical protein
MSRPPRRYFHYEAFNGVDLRVPLTPETGMARRYASDFYKREVFTFVSTEGVTSYYEAGRLAKCK